MSAEVVSLGGLKPAEILSNLLSRIEEIENVAVIIKWKDGNVTAGWSRQTNEELSFLNLTLDHEVRKGLA